MIFAHRSSSPRTFTRGLLAVLLCPLAGSAGRAQQPSSAIADEPVATLHVYMNLEQIPTLILNSDRERLKKPLAESSFRVSLDSGPNFKPAHVRPEGDDPISLSVLIDLTRPRPEILDGLAEALKATRPVAGNDAPDRLHAHDHVSVYVLDCRLLRTADDVPANPETLERAVDAGLDRWQARLKEAKFGKPACPKRVGLWDAISFTTAQLQKLPGRRVLLVVSDGIDRGSHRAWSDTMRTAEIDAVTVFGLLKQSDLPEFSVGPVAANFKGQPIFDSGGRAERPIEDPFDNICQSSGGLEIGTGSRTLDRSMARFVQMLRERYVVEFPRSDSLTAGLHTIAVTVEKFHGYIRPSGLTTPIADRKLLEDPTTLKSDPAAQVPVGTRKPLAPPG